MENAKNELELIKKYQAKGYSHNFRVVDNTLIDNSTKKEFKAEDIYIVAEHRFEGMSNPSDMSILYVLDMEGTKGTFLASYGSAADTEVAEFFNTVPKENLTNDENILM
ncbi:hypothetical protein [Polaribacter vadi]|uniref:hypothetical protein n=1 Tax=Polaribacter vadi TaxID=1774273 RepID=UPI0030EB5EA6